MSTTLFIAVVILIVIWANRYETQRKNKKIDTVFSGRERLTEEQFYQRFFQDRAIPFDIVQTVIRILAEQLDVDMSRLKDKDDFSKNLSFIWDFDSMTDVEIICALEKEFGITISDFEAENLKTVKDIIQLVAKKTEQTK